MVECSRERLVKKVIEIILANRFYRKHREQIMMICDLVVVAFSYLVAFLLKNDLKGFYFEDISIDRLLVSGVLVIVIYGLCFALFKIHRSLWKYISINEVIRIAEANLLATLVMILITNIFSKKVTYYVSIELIAMVISTVTMFALRGVYRLYRRSSHGYSDGKKTVIIGAGDGGTLLLREIQQNPNLGYRIIGFVDDNKVNKVVMGLNVLGTSKDLKELKEKYDLEVAIVAIPSLAKEDLNKLVENCHEIDLKIEIMNQEKVVLDGTAKKNYNPVAKIRIEDLLGRGEIKLDQSEISSYITDKVVVVTGAGGSIGSELCRQIVKFKPGRLIMIDINENGLYMLEQEFNNMVRHKEMDPSIVYISYIASIRDYKAIDNILKNERAEIVYHAAAHKHVPLMETRPMEAIKNNVFGTKNVIDACIANKVKRFIMISTDKAVNPTNVMGATKRMTEMILQAYGDNGVTKMAAVRFGNVLGSNGSVIPIFKRQIEEGGPVTITDRNIIRYFMTIPEAAQLVLQAGYYADKGEIFVLDMGKPVKILSLAEKMIKLSGYEPYKDIDIVEIGLRKGEKMFEELHLNSETFTKTKNDLIYENQIMKISKEAINERLDVLRDLLNKDTSNDEFKKTILDLIIKD